MRLPRILFVIPAIGLGAAVLSAVLPPALTAQSARFSQAETVDPERARASLTRAQEAAKLASQRADTLSAQADSATEAAERTATQAAALAARIQQAEADILAEQSRLAIITRRQDRLEATLAERQQPLVRLTAALQNMARRPLALSALRPGSLQDTVYVRAVLETTLPTVRARTSALREDLDESRTLSQGAASAVAALQASEDDLDQRRRALAALEARQRLASQEAIGVARRENERALLLAEQARDLDDLVGTLDRNARLRRELAALPGPILRPPRPGASRVLKDARTAAAPRGGAPESLQLPVQGRPLSGFGEVDGDGLRSNALVIAPRPSAQVVAPAAGRVAFAGPYRGYGRIVIIEHDGGWTSLVTGLGRIDAKVGRELVAGSPLGIAPVKDPAIQFELRKGGNPVNPLEFL